MQQDTLTAIELTGVVDEHRQLHLDQPLPLIGPKPVRVIVLYQVDDRLEEREWLQAAAQNPAFQSLHDPLEDIYSLDDGRPLVSRR